MVEGGAGPEFPVVFYDGEREMNIGSIHIYPLLQFKAFQLMLSQRIGISPNQISIYLCDRKINSKLEDRRRIPVTGKANFGIICREIDCFFLVVLKRSRKSRNRKAAARRVDPEMNQFGFGFDSGSLYYDQIMSELGYPNPYPDPFLIMTKNECEQCKGKIGNEKVSGFHHCVNDPVIAGAWRSRFGPVGGPVF
ncbi:hypothetical protein P3S68_020314 [Capsicum galapagoense]